MIYSVSRVNRNELLYMEDGRTVTVEVESGFDRPVKGPIGEQHLESVNLVVYTSTIRQWDDGVPIAADERDRIARNISEALTAAGTKHVIG
jgi:hypothetical protein